MLMMLTQLAEKIQKEVLQRGKVFHLANSISL